MKNLLFLALLACIALPAFAFAASGACSGHGGVSCSAGRDSDGSVICVDGWRNSSVSYASMVKCGGGSTAPKPAVSKPKATPSVVSPKPRTVTPNAVSKPVSIPAQVVEKKEAVRTVPAVQAVEVTKEAPKATTVQKVGKTETPRAVIVDAPVTAKKSGVSDFVRVWSFLKMIF